MPSKADDMVAMQPDNRMRPMTSMYVDVVEKTADPPTREPQLRPSRFPVCSLKLLDFMLSGKDRDASYLSEAYTNMGDGLHRALHSWAARQGSRRKLLGDWKCGNCGKETKFSVESECPSCGKPCEYVELETSYLGVKGHIDCVLLSDDGEISIGDYKTGTDWAVANKGVEGYRMANVYQLFAYAFMFFQTFGSRRAWRKGSASLLFVSRNNPRNFSEWSWDLEYAEKAGKVVLAEQLLAWKAAKDAYAANDSDLAYRARKCESVEHYEDVVEKTMYGGCKLADKCVYASKRDVDAHFAGLMDEGRER